MAKKKISEMNWTLSKIYGYYTFTLSSVLAFTVVNGSTILLAALPSIAILFAGKSIGQNGIAQGPSINWTPGKIFAYLATTVMACITHYVQDPIIMTVGIPSMVCYFTAKNFSGMTKDGS